jgi:dihydrofolate reductase
MTHQKPTVSAIVAMAENRVIGFNNTLPWQLPADLKHFKTITSGHPVIMGRKTFASIGRPLPNRTNIILTRDHAFSAPDCLIATEAATALALAKNADPEEIFVIGGAEIYKQMLPQVDRVYLTVVHQVFEGDTYFPALSSDEWKEISSERFQADDKNPHEYSFIVLER